MKKLTKNEMLKIEGGVNWVVVTFVSAAVSFVAGIFEGIINPKRCNS